MSQQQEASIKSQRDVAGGMSSVTSSEKNQHIARGTLSLQHHVTALFLCVCVFFFSFAAATCPLQVDSSRVSSFVDLMVDLIKYLGMNKFNVFFFLINPIFKLAMPTFIINSLRLNVQTEYRYRSECWLNRQYYRFFTMFTTAALSCQTVSMTKKECNANLC